MIIPIKSYSERRKNFALRMHNGIAIIPIFITSQALLNQKRYWS